MSDPFEESVKRFSLERKRKKKSGGCLRHGLASDWWWWEMKESWKWNHGHSYYQFKRLGI